MHPNLSGKVATSIDQRSTLSALFTKNPEGIITVVITTVKGAYEDGERSTTKQHTVHHFYRNGAATYEIGDDNGKKSGSGESVEVYEMLNTMYEGLAAHNPHHKRSKDPRDDTLKGDDVFKLAEAMESITNAFRYNPPKKLTGNFVRGFWVGQRVISEISKDDKTGDLTLAKGMVIGQQDSPHPHETITLKLSANGSVTSHHQHAYEASRNTTKSWQTDPHEYTKIAALYAQLHETNSKEGLGANLSDKNAGLLEKAFDKLYKTSITRGSPSTASNLAR